jgi:hypothetical protein
MMVRKEWKKDNRGSEDGSVKRYSAETEAGFSRKKD